MTQNWKPQFCPSGKYTHQSNSHQGDPSDMNWIVEAMSNAVIDPHGHAQEMKALATLTASMTLNPHPAPSLLSRVELEIQTIEKSLHTPTNTQGTYRIQTVRANTPSKSARHNPSWTPSYAHYRVRLAYLVRLKYPHLLSGKYLGLDLQDYQYMQDPDECEEASDYLAPEILRRCQTGAFEVPLCSPQHHPYFPYWHARGELNDWIAGCWGVVAGRGGDLEVEGLEPMEKL
ncbi:hypothetical protein BS50DRAFT_581896 [Corynespora cassiicola Philippines]|uniref:Uncharacterized protein n=1 Tax=Corynespora cassiicola Philippines TaxID=1448308 RepID=A0A2T2PBY8_CORCC|nr:hypothetical protein BS50DRAFT_581896 [Corynespora cassiicola Philippines]